MNEQQVIQIVQNEMGKQTNTNTYNTLSVPRHVHNGVDSPELFQMPILTYIGSVGQFAVIPNEVFLLPNGWTVTFPFGSGNPRITHNLGSLLYAVACTSTNPVFSLPPFAIFQVSNYLNYFDVFIFDSKVQNVVDLPFQFILTTVNNKKVTTPGYHGVLVPP